MNRRAMFKHLLPIACLAALLTAGGCKPQPAPEIQGTVLADTPIGGPFELVDKTGKTVRWDQFMGKYRIVYFGYTFCPDACPTDVAVMMRGFDRFAKDHPALADQVQPLFITVDPARDTPQAVGQFAAAFSPRLIGLTGSPEQIAAAIKAFRVYAAKGRESTGGYLMDHSRFAYLMDREGRPIEALPVDKGAAAVASDLALSVK